MTSYDAKITACWCVALYNDFLIEGGNLFPATLPQPCGGEPASVAEALHYLDKHPYAIILDRCICGECPRDGLSASVAFN